MLSIADSSFTDQEALLLSQLAYADLADEEDVLNLHGGMSLAKIVDRLRNAGTVGSSWRRFRQYGGLKQVEYENMFEQIAGHEHLARLKLKDYINENREGGLVAYAFEDKDATPVICFRGTEGTELDGGGVESLAGLFREDWIDNYCMGLLDCSRQFDSAAAFVEARLKTGPAQCFVTGHSKGAANAMYAVSLPGRWRQAADSRHSTIICGKVFGGPGIGQCLDVSQWQALEESALVNYAGAADPVGALLFHPEKRVFCRQKNEKVAECGVFGAHYTQEFSFSELESGETVDKAEQSALSRFVQNVSMGVHASVHMQTPAALLTQMYKNLPPGWNVDRLLDYWHEYRETVEGMRSGNRHYEAALMERVKKLAAGS